MKRFNLVILRFLRFWKVFETSGISGPGLVVNCRLSESAINSALLVVAKIKQFGLVRRWNGCDLFRRDFLSLLMPMELPLWSRESRTIFHLFGLCV